MQPADGAPMEGVGSIIAAAREERGLTVEDVSEATRIRATLIRQIEQDDFSACGGMVYARGHIRSVARVLGVDPAPIVAAFDSAHGQVQAPLVAPAPEFDPLPQHDRPRGHRGIGWAPLMIGSLTVVCIVALVMLVLPDSSGDGKAGRSGNPGAPVQAGASPSAAPAPTTPSAPPTSMNVRVEAREDATWIEVRDDREQVLVQQLLERGQERTVVTERPVSIKMGNAGAAGLSCNGRDVGVLGDPGAVVTVRLVLAASGDCTSSSEKPGGVAAAPAPLG
jgi:cytoskeletal protein RodZ